MDNESTSNYPCAQIDTQALKINIAELRRCAPQSRLMAVVKANAYGHGLIRIANAAEAADAFAVARISEAFQLRNNGIQKKIVLLEGVSTADELAAALQHDLDVVLHDPSQLHFLKHQTDFTRANFWIKIDTGMNRLGFLPSKVPNIVANLMAVGAIRSELQLMTHFSSADAPNDRYTSEQHFAFMRVCDELGSTFPHLKISTSTSNSAGILFWPRFRSDWIRAGLALYGISPRPDRSDAELGLRPVMTFRSKLIAIKDVGQNTAVGYSRSWIAPRNSRIGIVAVGYGDGLPRTLDNGAALSIRGKLAPVVGRVSMDMTAVDITDMSHVGVGEPVEIWGANQSIWHLSHYARTIPYELLCRVNQRVSRTAE